MNQNSSVWAEPQGRAEVQTLCEAAVSAALAQKQGMPWVEGDLKDQHSDKTLCCPLAPPFPALPATPMERQAEPLAPALLSCGKQLLFLPQKVNFGLNEVRNNTSGDAPLTEPAEGNSWIFRI